MPKNKKRGKNAKNKWKAPKKELVFKDSLQEYCLMIKMLGDRRIRVQLPDGSFKMAIIPGRFRKRNWMKQGDILLASFREFQKDKMDIIHKYSIEEARKLVTYHEIPSSFINTSSETNIKDDDVLFNYEDELDFDNI